MQPGVVPGAVLELHAAKAALGLTPGINSPLTTQAFDTSGGGNHGTLTNFGVQTPWQGSGTVANPYRLVFDGTNDYVAMPDMGVAEGARWTYECWAKDDGASSSTHRWLWREAGNSPIRSGITAFNGGFRAYSRDATAAVTVSYGSTYSGDGYWHHVVGINDGTYLRLYIDGVARGTPLAPRPPAAVSSTCLGTLDGTIECWIGGIALARAYPFALTAAHVAQNYNAGPLWAPAVSGFPVIGSPILQGMRV